MSGRSVLISGASSGIGNATVLRFAKKGWRVFAAVRKEEDADAIARSGFSNVESVLLDISDRTSIRAAKIQIEHRLEMRGLDGLVNNAGIGVISPVECISPDDLRRIFEINLFGQVDMVQAYLPLIRKAKGRIVNIGSVVDHLTPPFVGALAGSKAAFASITAALRLELRTQGIRVCLIEPGSINTPAVEKTLGGVEKTIAAWVPEAKEIYAASFKQMADAFAQDERRGSAPDAVARTIERAMTARSPAARYPAGRHSTTLALLARFLPEKLVDFVVLKTFGLSTTFGEP